MANSNCPCNGCVPPKRTSTCHGTCKEYKDWDIAHKQELVKIREAKATEWQGIYRPIRNYSKRRDD